MNKGICAASELFCQIRAYTVTNDDMLEVLQNVVGIQMGIFLNGLR